MASRSVLVSLALGSLGVVAVACGGSSEEGLFGNGSGSGGSAGATNGGSGGSTSGGTAGTGDGGTAGVGNGGAGGASGAAATGGAAGTAATGGATGGNGGTPSGGGAPTGGTGGGTGGNPGGGGTAGVTGTVQCGDGACSVGEYCCLTFSSGSWKGACQTGSCQGIPVKCDDQSDCAAGTTCCGHLNFIMTSYEYVQCVPSAQCGDDNQDRLVCGGFDAVCTGGTTCETSSIIPPYEFCL